MTDERDLLLVLLERLSWLNMDSNGDDDLVAERNNITVRHAQSIVTNTLREWERRP